MTYASRQGYFELPKKISTQQIADHFGISTSTVINHIQKAEKILVKFHFG
jgi:predicted DNA binding protein